MSTELTIPEPRIELSVRVATLADGPFIDELQKMHTHMVGFLAKKALIAYIEGGYVLIAEGCPDFDQTRRRGDTEEREGLGSDPSDSDSSSAPQRLRVETNQQKPRPLGYIIAKDRYLKRDDVGIVYQLNVLPLTQRKLIGASLVKATFERAAYGCRLFSCWCAQDIQANWFWESLGFVPLAFRTGSRGKQRIHIFWQARTRAEENQRSTDGTPVPPSRHVGMPPTPYWFPSQTAAGAVREDRIVFPIPIGTHWRDAKPVVLPVVLPGVPEMLKIEEEVDRKWLPAARPNAGKPGGGGVTKESHARKLETIRSNSKHLKGTPPGKAAVVTSSGMKYVDRADYVPEPEPPKKPKKPRQPKQKYDPKVIEVVRELRDRYLEEVERFPELLPSEGRYDVSRPLLLANTDDSLRSLSMPPGTEMKPEANPARLLEQSEAP